MRVPPLLVLQARAEARYLLYLAGEFDLGEATDPLLAYARKERIADPIAHRIINRAFGLQQP